MYLPTGSQEQHFTFRQVLCNYLTDELNFLCLQSFVTFEYKCGRDYIDKMKFQGSTWGNELMIFATMQITEKCVVTHINGQWEWYCASGTF